MMPLAQWMKLSNISFWGIPDATSPSSHCYYGGNHNDLKGMELVHEECMGQTLFMKGQVFLVSYSSHVHQDMPLVAAC